MRLRRRNSPSFAALALVVAGIAVAPARALAAPLTLTGPASAVGDGTTAIQLTLTSARRLPRALGKALALTNDAGRFGAATRVDDHHAHIAWTPPRVAFEHKATLRAELRLGRRRYRARLQLTTTPAKRVVARVRSKGGVAIEAPASAVLGQTRSFIVRLRRVPGRAHKLHVNIGKLSLLRITSPQQLEATYTLPAALYPQIAVFVVTSTGERPVDWLAVPLLGQAQIRTTTERGAMVSVKAGGVVYGPLRADRRGHATIGILAPPGLADAQTFARDRLGNTRSKRVSLGAPAFSQATTICSSSADRVFAVAVDRAGNALPASALSFRSPRAAFSPAVAAKHGAIEALVRLDDSTQLGDRVVVTTTVGTIVNSGSTCKLAVRGGPVRRLVVTTAPDQFVAGSGTSIVVRVSLRDAAGKPAQPTVPGLSVELGTLSRVLLESGATYRAVWTLPNEFAGNTRVDVRAQIGTLSAKPASLALRSGPIATIHASAARDTLAANGTSTTTVTARANDAFGNPAPVDGLSYRARGRLRARPRESGLELGYTSFATRHRVVDDVIITDSKTGVSARVPIILTPDLGKLSLTARLGFMSDFGEVSGPTVSADAQLRSPLLGGRLFARLHAGYGRSRETRPAAMPTTELVTETITLVPVLAGAYVDVITVPVSIYIGVAGGLTYGAVGIESANTGRVVNTSWSYAAAASLGTHIRLGPGDINLELSQLLAKIRAAPLNKVLPVLQLEAGYRLQF